MRFVKLRGVDGLRWHVLDMKDASFPRVVCTCEGYDAWQHVTEVCEALNERDARLYDALSLTSHTSSKPYEGTCSGSEVNLGLGLATLSSLPKV